MGEEQRNMAQLQGGREDQRAIPDALGSLNEGFSNESMPRYHLEGLLYHRVLGPAPQIFCFKRPLGGDQRISI